MYPHVSHYLLKYSRYLIQQSRTLFKGYYITTIIKKMPAHKKHNKQGTLYMQIVISAHSANILF